MKAVENLLIKGEESSEIRFSLKAVRRSHCGSAETNLTRIPEDASSIPGLTHRVKDPELP